MKKVFPPGLILSLSLVLGLPHLASADVQDEDDFEDCGRFICRSEILRDGIRVGVESGHRSDDYTRNSPRDTTPASGTTSSLPLPVGAAPVPLQRVDPRLGFEVPDCRPDETGASADWTCWSPQAQQFFIVPPGSDDAEDEEGDTDEAPGVSLGDLAGAVREFTRVQISPAAASPGRRE